MIQAIEVQVISKILTCYDDQETLDTLLAFPPDLYFSGYLREIQYIHNQRDRYNIIPSVFDFQAEFPDFSIVTVTEPLDYLVAKLREYRRRLILIETFNKVKDLGDGDTDIYWKYIGSQYEKAMMLEETHPMDIVRDADIRAEQIKEYNKQRRIPTGFDEIDKLMYGGLSTVEELAVIIARTNSGKAQPLWAPVLTPHGWSTMGDLKVGDTVIGANNDNGRVVQIFPQGEKEYYRVYFDDTTYAECCKDHLWVVIDDNHNEQTLTLSQIMDSGNSTSYSVPLCGVIDYAADEKARNKHLIDKIGPTYDNLVHFHRSFRMFEGQEIAEVARSLGLWVKADYVDAYHVDIEIDKTKHAKKIQRIEYIGTTECQCILLDNESHTYITSDYTVTHNTWVCTKLMESAQKNEFPVAYYSPEMQAAYLGTRFDTWRGHFENNKLFRGDYSQEYYAYMKSLQGENTSAYVIEDKDFPDGVSVRTLEPFVNQHGIKLLIVDGISYMNDDQRATRDQEKFKNIALGLFKLSKKYGCAVVLVMQANREVKNKDDKGESIPTLYNAEGSDQPARIATQAFGIRQIFDKHVLDISLLKSRMADNRNPVFSYAWDINTGQTQFIPGGDSEDSSVGGAVGPTPQISTPTISFGDAQPDTSDLSLLDDAEDDSLVEF